MIARFAVALLTAAVLAQVEGKPAEAERLASEASNCQRVRISRSGWLRGSCSAAGRAVSWVILLKESRASRRMEGYRATGAIHGLACYLFLKAQALSLANRTPEALETIEEATH